jgi:hypothetical protein
MQWGLQCAKHAQQHTHTAQQLVISIGLVPHRVCVRSCQTSRSTHLHDHKQHAQETSGCHDQSKPIRIHQQHSEAALCCWHGPPAMHELSSFILPCSFLPQDHISPPPRAGSATAAAELCQEGLGGATAECWIMAYRALRRQTLVGVEQGQSQALAPARHKQRQDTTQNTETRGLQQLSP